MQKKEVVVTYAGLTKLEHELNHLKTVRRKEVADKIPVARGYGAQSENSEHDAAKPEQGNKESRIADLETMLKNLRVIDEDELTTEHVMVGSRVRVRDDEGEEEVYDIVGSTEADPATGRISDESPVGGALMNHGVGDVVEVSVPSGAVLEYEILEISKSEL
ncbi:MAG: transcription elongation factor GreA [Oscillospiraceae bacterium]